MGLLDKFKDKVSKPSSSAQAPASPASAPPAQPLGPHDIPRYRRQIGVNLGSWFVLERWITPRPFREAASPGQSDHDVARGGNPRAILEDHWDSWIHEDDWKWIKDQGYNSVRLPIGYYHLVKAVPDVIKGTDFEALGGAFEGAWERIETAIAKAASLDLGVMIDLHAAAGAQNGDAHAGMSNGKPRLFDSKANLTSTSLALQFLASHFATNPHVIGLELLNEPANNSHLQKWYESTLAAIRPSCGPHFPIYIHDAWDTQWYAGWVGRRDDFVVLDHHLYRCFTGDDKALTGQQHATKLLHQFQGGFAGQSNQAKGNIVVAEWSASLDLSKFGMHTGDQDAEKRAFVKAELELYEKHTAGSWFWTLKKGEGWDAGWSAMNATQAEILPAWMGRRQFKGDPGDGIKQQALQLFHGTSVFRATQPIADRAAGQHTSYWQANGGLPNPSLFESAFNQGWADALLFYSSSQGSELGFVNQWARRRLDEYKISGHNICGSGWEWEHAFAQAAAEVKRVCLE